MRITGALIGLALGLFVGEHVIGSAMLGGLIGALAGVAIGRLFGSESAATLRDLKAEIDLLRRRVESLERRSAGGVEPAAPSAEKADAAPATPLRIAESPQPREAVTSAAAAPAAEEQFAAESRVVSPGQTWSDVGARDPFSIAWSWLTGGNVVVRVGVVVLFFGVAFLLKYAYEHARIPPELRLTGVAFGSIVMLVIGWRLRERRADYAAVMQGGAVGVLYLDVFAALRLYEVLPPAAAFVLLVAIAAFSAVIAVLQDSRALAVLGAAGGFLAPVLASTGGGSHVQLFSYYAVLNAGILAVAWFRSWRALNLVGFAFTFVIGTLWGNRYYRPEFFATTEPFLVFFFLFYLAIPILFARREALTLKGYVDGTLVFGVPLTGFGLQLALVRDMEYGAAWSALALAVFYVALARALWTRAGERLRLLAEAFLALGVVFGTLAAPLAFDGRWTSAVWALEGAAIVWIGVRQGRRLARAFGMALQPAAGVAYLVGTSRFYESVPVLNSVYLGGVLVAIAGLFSAWYLQRHRDAVKPWERVAAMALFIWGLLWWAGGGLHEIDRHVAWQFRLAAALMFFGGSLATLSLLGRMLAWKAAARTALGIVVLNALALIAWIADQRHPGANLGYLAWPLAFAVHLWVLRRQESESVPPNAKLVEWLHAVGLWAATAVGAWELGWWIDRWVEGRHVWPLIAWALLPGAVLLAVRSSVPSWPVRAHLRAYFIPGAAPVAAFMILWTLAANATSTGDPAPLPYVPVLNPLDLALAAALLAVALWFTALARSGFITLRREERALFFAILGGAAFVSLNGALLRTLHHWADVPFDLDAMLRSMLVQTALSIFWTLIALGAMVFATRRALRPLWIAGAVLMGVVVVKLFFVDLSSVGGVERIVSFIAVGVLMLVIGYLSPVPPRKEEAQG